MQLAKRPYTLTIAGFDPSGGAGLLADIKTFETIGTQGLAVITANTMQVEDAFYWCDWMPTQRILAQIDLLCNRYPVAVAKIGIVRSFSQLARITSRIRQHNREITIIIDPVLRPTKAQKRMLNPHRGSIRQAVAQQDLLTPNLEEFAQIFGKKEPAEVAQRLGCNLLIKGGHDKNDESVVTDTLYANGEKKKFQTERSALAKHGTGCILSAAITAHLALGKTLTEACDAGQKYIAKYINSDPSLLGQHCQ